MGEDRRTDKIMDYAVFVCLAVYDLRSVRNWQILVKIGLLLDISFSEFEI